MSDEVYTQSAAPVIDGKNLINVPGASGITSVNGDNTPAQIIAAGDGLEKTDAGATHTLKVKLLPLGGIQFDAPSMALAIKADAPLAFGGMTGDLQLTIKPPLIVDMVGELELPAFTGDGAPGYVPDPGLGLTNRQLLADGRWYFNGPVLAAPAAGNISLPDNTLTDIVDYTVPSVNNAGSYLLLGSVKFAADAVGERMVCFEFGGNVVYAVQQMAITDAHSNGNIVQCFGVIDLANGDTIKLKAKQTSGGAINAIVDAAFAQTYMLLWPITGAGVIA